MRFIANFLWFILGGWFWGLVTVISGAIWCVTIIGIPFGLACFRLSVFMFFPFGKELVDARDFGEDRVVGTGLMSFLWIILSGLWLAISLGFTGLCCFCTIIGIPFGIAYLKIAAAAFNPLGKRIVSVEVAEVIRARKASALVDAKVGK